MSPSETLAVLSSERAEMQYSVIMNHNNVT